MGWPDWLSGTVCPVYEPQLSAEFQGLTVRLEGHVVPSRKPCVAAGLINGQPACSNVLGYRAQEILPENHEGHLSVRHSYNFNSTDSALMLEEFVEIDGSNVQRQVEDLDLHGLPAFPFIVFHDWIR